MTANRTPDDDDKDDKVLAQRDATKSLGRVLRRNEVRSRRSCPKYALLLLVTYPAAAAAATFALERPLEVHAPVLPCSVNPYELVYRDRPSPGRS